MQHVEGKAHDLCKFMPMPCAACCCKAFGYSREGIIIALNVQVVSPGSFDTDMHRRNDKCRIPAAQAWPKLNPRHSASVKESPVGFADQPFPVRLLLFTACVECLQKIAFEVTDCLCPCVSKNLPNGAFAAFGISPYSIQNRKAVLCVRQEIAGITFIVTGR